MREPNLGRLLWVSFATDAAHAEIHRCPLRPKTDRQPLEHNLSRWANCRHWRGPSRACCLVVMLR